MMISLGSYSYIRKNRKKLGLIIVSLLLVFIGLSILSLSYPTSTDSTTHYRVIAHRDGGGVMTRSQAWSPGDGRSTGEKLIVASEEGRKRRRDVSFSLSNHTDPMIEVSQNSNQLQRERFQRKRVHKFCTRHKRQMRYFVFPYKSEERQLLFDHLLFNDKHKTIFCHVEQIQCSYQTARQFTNSELWQQKSSNYPQQSNTIYASKVYDPSSITTTPVEQLDSAIIESFSFSNSSLNSITKRRRLKEYYKTMIVANPLTRLLSSYLNLIQSKPLMDLQNTETFPNNIKIEILEKYRSMEYRHWKSTGMTYPLQVTFSEFIEYIIDKSFADLSPHFRPVTDLCQPCRIHYDFYGNDKLCHQDSTHILVNKMKLSSLDDSKTDSEDIDKYLMKYYRQLPQRLTTKLVSKWYIEFDFYYHLYPEERNSHKILLDI